MDMEHERVTWTCNRGMQDKHAKWTFMKDKQRGHAACKYGVNIQL
jgi:hypothetical protein